MKNFRDIWVCEYFVQSSNLPPNRKNINQIIATSRGNLDQAGYPLKRPSINHFKLPNRVVLNVNRDLFHLTQLQNHLLQRHNVFNVFQRKPLNWQRLLPQNRVCTQLILRVRAIINFILIWVRELVIF